MVTCSSNQILILDIYRRKTDYAENQILWAFPTASWFGKVAHFLQAQCITEERKCPGYIYAVPRERLLLPHSPL